MNNQPPQISISFKRVLPDAAPPRAWNSGLHLPAYARSESGHPVKIMVTPHIPKLIRTGIRLNLPSGVIAFLVTRRDDAKRSLMVVNAPVAFDSDAEVKFVLINSGLETQVIHHGDLVANLIFLWSARPELIEAA